MADRASWPDSLLPAGWRTVFSSRPPQGSAAPFDPRHLPNRQWLSCPETDLSSGLPKLAGIARVGRSVLANDALAQTTLKGGVPRGLLAIMYAHCVEVFEDADGIQCLVSPFDMNCIMREVLRRAHIHPGRLPVTYKPSHPDATRLPARARF